MKTEETIISATAGSKTRMPEKATKAKKTATPAARKTSKATASKKAARPASGEARADTKKAIVLELLRRKQGATTAEIANATDWQNHSIRGFISGHVTKKMGLKVESTKNEAGERTYRIAK
jgi:hypothetical protein